MTDEEYPGTKLLNYPLFLRDGEPPARLILPMDLTKAEVRRLVKYMESLVIDEVNRAPAVSAACDLVSPKSPG